MDIYCVTNQASVLSSCSKMWYDRNCNVLTIISSKDIPYKHPIEKEYFNLSFIDYDEVQKQKKKIAFYNVLRTSVVLDPESGKLTQSFSYQSLEDWHYLENEAPRKP